MYTLKSIAQRGTLFGAVAALVVAAVIPATSAFADSLNPLTERSLLLTSSAPGWQDTDGSGNSEGSLNSNGQYFAPPGSGPNGKKSGETFSFKVSTDSAATSTPIKALTFQYCTSAAGNCQAPGDNSGDASTLEADNTTARTPDRGADTVSTSDFNVNYTNPVFGTDFKVFVNDVEDTVPGNWTMTTKNVEDEAHSGRLTGKKNFIVLSSADGVSPAFDQQIRVVFNASSTNYITNPGSGAFFVKINTYKTEAGASDANLLPATDDNIIDGGVTVANVMTDSIHITTKVLETMAFSVGTHNRDTDDLDGPAGSVRNGTCDAIQVVNNNRLDLGNPDAEYSLETGRAWDVYSYWRLSSNSSGGATVYYSGDTLRNTVGDFIAPMDPTITTSNPGTEQFGLAFVDDTELQTEVSPSFLAEIANDSDNYKLPAISPLNKGTNYLGGSGNIGLGDLGETIDAQFAFDVDSQTTPAVIAQNNNAVLSCATAKMRYVGNIAADTPAGVYTTKINYLAAPQY